MNHWRLHQAARVVAQGGIIAYPTEAVWGLGCDPFSYFAVQRLLQLKQRSESKGLILVAADISHLGPLYKTLTESERTLLTQKTEKPTTWLVPDRQGLIPSWIKGSHAEVAIRISTNPLVKQLCLNWGGLLVSTSANKSTEPPALSAQQVRQQFSRQIDYLLPGPLGGYNKPSEIRSLRDGSISRPG